MQQEYVQTENGKYVVVKGGQFGLSDGPVPEGLWKIIVKGGITYFKNGDGKDGYMRIFEDGKKQDCRGTGGPFTEFTFVPHRNGSFSLVSRKYPSFCLCYKDGSIDATVDAPGSPGTTFHFKKQTNGTIKPTPNHDAKADAQLLRSAMKGFGTNETEIISVIGKRTSDELVQVAREFKTLFGRDLEDDIKDETRGNFEDALVARLQPLNAYLAKCLRKAIAGAGTDEECLIEIICTKSNAEILAICEEYQKLFNRSLEKDVENDASGNFKRLLVSLLQGNRDEDAEDAAEAAKDASGLYNAGEGKIGTDESKFNQILASRSFAQIRLIDEEYRKISSKSLESAIKDEMSGSVEKGMLAIVRAAKDTPGFFATRLYEAMKGAGTDDKTLIRVVSSRCEIDMEDIKKSFLDKYQKSLAQFIEDDTNGDYRRLLIQIVGA